jgi:hypothetical protein
MKIRFSRLRTFLLTFILGLTVAASFDTGRHDDVPVNVPEVESTTPIIIRLCPEWETTKGYWEDGNLYFSTEKAMNCAAGGGAS